MNYRTERDTMGEIQVPAEKYWGAQTQRSIEFFPIGPSSSMPLEIIHAFGYLKKAAAITNNRFGLLSDEKMKIIVRVCDEITEGSLDDQFPLVIYQTGSGTHTNMNCNEVISNRAHVLLGNNLGEGKKLIHPNDDVNMSQSSNDTFPTAMHIAAVKLISENLVPALEKLIEGLLGKSLELSGIIKTGRTHLMDATPITLGQEFSGYVSQLEHGVTALRNTLPHLSELALGGNVVGTGLNTPEGYDRGVAEVISRLTNLHFVTASNKFEALASNDAVVESHGAIRQLAVSLMKIANDIRLSASGPRSGFAEIYLPANEPGSSTMPGKINPTQAEAITMVCSRVLGNDTTITIAGSGGHFELNVYKPVMISAFLQSASLMSDACRAFNDFCIKGIKPNTGQIEKNLRNSLMLVTALNPHIGYENAAKIAIKAYEDNCTLREAALQLGLVTEEQFDKWVDPAAMTGPDLVP